MKIPTSLLRLATAGLLGLAAGAAAAQTYVYRDRLPDAEAPAQAPAGPDSTPDAFSFVDLVDQALSTQVTSAAVTPLGYDTAAAISISGEPGACYIIDGGACETAAGTISPGSSVAVRLTTSAAEGTAVSATLTIGGVSDVFSATTLTSGPPLSLALAAATLPDGEVGAAYAPFDFKTLVTITGGPTSPPLTAADLTWSAVGVPGGMSVSALGVLSGTPSAAGTASIVVTVEHASVTETFAYDLVVIDPATALVLTGE